MSDYYDVKKLCALSRLEIVESEFQKTADKIKETMAFFNKLDEFEIVMDDKQGAPDNSIKMEKRINDLRDDIPKSGEKTTTDTENNISFDFLNKKNGYAIGPRI